jgi:hypothetical protein
MPARAKRFVTTSLTAAPEHGERPALGSDQGGAEVADLHALRALRGHQGKLVERQRPDGADRLDKGDASRVALLDVLDDPVVGRVGLGVAERRRVLVGAHLARADCDEQRVVVHAQARAGVDHLDVRVDPAECVLYPLSLCVTRDPAQRIAPWSPEGERLANRERPVDELLAGGDQLDPHRVAHETTQPEKPLRRRDPSTADHNPKSSHCSTVGLAGYAGIGSPPQRTGGELRTPAARARGLAMRR